MQLPGGVGVCPLDRTVGRWSESGVVSSRADALGASFVVVLWTLKGEVSPEP
jgi:hypothetical protein